jgi:hypothetical protein
MQLNEKQLKKYQELYEERFGIKLSFEEICEKAESLVRIVELTYKPMTKKELAMVEKRRKKLFNN